MPFPVDHVGDAVIAGVDVLLSHNLAIRSDQQLQNICDNVILATAQKDLERLDDLDPDAYATLTRPTDLIDRPYALQTSAGDDQRDLFMVNSYLSGSTADNTFCVVEFDRAPDNSSYGDPAFSAHKASGVRVLMGQGSAPITQAEELSAAATTFFDVPRWFAISPDTPIADLAK